MDAIAAIIERFGWQAGGIILVVGGLAITVRVLATRLERAYDKRVEAIDAGHEAEVAAIKDGFRREIDALKEHSAKGWEMADAFQVQAQRLAERYGDATELSRDLADEALERRRARKTR